ncbi:MAG: GTP 3',8-cyclase MoaA [Anaerolineae bacterium]|nr:GTP 3',8-cyclase MoaA [Anaerolineae bacterium]
MSKSSKKMSVIDSMKRPLGDLRISVTDRCNFRCSYCMPGEIFGKDYQFLPKEDVLTFEEIERIVRVFAGLGVDKVRLTGGEPMMRRDLESLISMLAVIPGVEDLALTTNGSFSLSRVKSLKEAGLGRMSVSLDALDDEVFMKMNDVDFSAQRVLDWIETSAASGFSQVKVNMVVKRGLNEDSLLPMARYFKQQGHILRVIEYMDVGQSNGWRLEDVVTAKQMVRRIHEELPLEAIDANYRGEVAKRYRYVEGGGEIGVIASVTQPFCGDCTRMRLSADGKLFTCLFAVNGHDLRGRLREGASDEEVREYIQAIWGKRDDRYSELRTAQTADLPKVEMSYIGG